MKISRDNWEDVKRYYVGTYVKFKETGDHVWKVSHVDPEHLLAIDDRGEEIGIDMKLEYEIEYVIPGRAAFQYADMALALVRQPARQFYRGLHYENTKFMFLTAQGVWRQRELDFPTVQAFVNKPVYHSVETMLLSFNKDCQTADQSWALSPYICVSASGAVTTASGTGIGSISFDKGKIRANKLFYPELEALGFLKHFSFIKAPSGPRKTSKKAVVKYEEEYALAGGLE